MTTGFSSAVGSALTLEREAEMAVLAATLDAARLGEGRLVLVEGSAGIGKTRLLAEVRALAAAEEFGVLTARGGELEGQFAFGIVRQLFEAPLAAATRELRAELMAGAAELSASLFASAPTVATDGAAESSFAMLHGLYWLAANFASRKPTLLLVDDLHWADEPSLRWLVYLSHRLEGLPLLLLIATRPPAQANAPAFVNELIADPRATIIRPEPLGPLSIQALAREFFEVEPETAFIAELEIASGGNPLFARALLDAAARDGIPPTAEHAARLHELGPEIVSHAVTARLARLPNEATELIRAAAILGDGTKLGRVAALANLEDPAAGQAAHALVIVDLLRREDPIEFFHPLVRTVVHEAMNAMERMAKHRRAAEVLLATGALPEQAAAHLMPTNPGGDPFVVTTLRSAAQRSLVQGAPETAVVYLRRALAEPPATRERTDVLFELGRCELATNVADANEHLREAVEEVDDATGRPDIVLKYAQSLVSFGRPAEAIELLRRTCDGLRDTDPDMYERLESTLILSCAFEPSLQPIAAERIAAVRVDRFKGDVGTALLTAHLAWREALAGGSREQAVTFARQALGSRLLIGAGEQLYVAVLPLTALTLAGELTEAAEGFDEPIELAVRRGDLNSIGSLRLYRGWLKVQQGELLHAEDDLRAFDFKSLPLSIPNLSLHRDGFLAEVLVERDLDGALELIDVAFPPDIAPGHQLHLLLARGRVLLETGAAEKALAELSMLAETADAIGMHNPAYYPWRSRAALAYHALGHADQARSLAHEELELSRNWGAPRAIGVSLRALGLVEGGHTGRQLLREAVDILAGSTARLEYARALTDLGAALRRDNSRSEARQLLRSGVDLAYQCGATRLVERANEELAATGAHPRTIFLRGIDALTASERRVAQMAADDMSNKDIAQRLFVTVKTVEQHLGRVYRKLEISSRKQLGTALVATAESSAET